MHPAIKSVCVGLSFHPTISCHALSIYIVKTSKKNTKKNTGIFLGKRSRKLSPLLKSCSIFFCSNCFGLQCRSVFLLPSICFLSLGHAERDLRIHFLLNDLCRVFSCRTKVSLTFACYYLMRFVQWSIVQLVNQCLFLVLCSFLHAVIGVFSFN